MLFLVLALCFAAQGGCANSAWKKALADDSPAAYYRYIRDHSGSSHVAEAKERLEFHKLQRNLTLQNYSKFEERFPNSALVASIRPQLEQKSFQAARGQGSPGAYKAFLAEFPNGSLAERAEGNARFLEARGFGADPARLAAFAERHPQSDFAAEARSSVEVVKRRDDTRFAQVALSVQISPSTPEADRLTNAFVERAMEAYEKSEVRLVRQPELAGRAAPVRLVIRHSEGESQTSVSKEGFSRPGFVATTRVTLERAGEKDPIWSREFSARVDATDHISNSSILFSSVAPRYWEEFFVPLASWQSADAVSGAVGLGQNVVAVDAAMDRAVVLFQDGSFRVLELSRPSEPVTLSEYSRPNDLKKFGGVKILSDGVAVYGEDGLELIRFGEQGPEVTMVRDRGQVGSVFELASVGDELVLAGPRGLLLVPKGEGDARRVLRRVIHGVAAIGETLVLADGESVLVSTLPLLQEGRVLAQLRLGREFAPRRVRSFGNTALVVSDGGVLVIDLAKASAPRVLAQLYAPNIGKISDVAQVRGQIFLVGERGISALSRNADRVVETIDVVGRYRAAPMGRHVVIVGDGQLQVVDTTPFTQRSAPARPSPTSAPN